MKIEANISFPFVGILTILFVAFKLSGIIAWSWWWVLSPLWLPPTLLIFGFMVFITILKTIKLFINYR